MKESILSGSSFCYANCFHTVWENCSINNCTFKEAFFSESRLKKLKLQEINFSNTDFFRTALKDIDLSACTIEGIMVSDTFQELKGLKINSAQAVTLVHLLGVKVE
ncbi:MAG: pentapeptide repeat-containing protein [Clostridiales bacterium]